MKLLTLSAAALLLSATPVQAQWYGNPAESAAQAYCASRAAGRDDRQASNDAWTVMSTMVRPGFESIFTTVLPSGRQQTTTAKYLARQMCPEYFGQPLWEPSPLAPGPVQEFAPPKQKRPGSNR